MKPVVALLLLIFASLNYYVYGQGCSDAGFCSISGLKPSANDTSKAVKINALKIAASAGKANHSINVLGYYIEYSRKLGSKIGVDARLLFLHQDGNGISVAGAADVLINASYSADEKIMLTAGLKIPLNDANKQRNGLSLPMDYQSSLGTVDFVAGVTWFYEKAQIVFALQQPLKQNGNRFFPEAYPSTSVLSRFQATNKFVRSGDVLARVSYPINFASKLVFTPGLLPIYHLANDKYSDVMDTKKPIKGSQGLTLNVNAYFNYALNAANELELSFGAPVVTRKIQPDGLKRSYVYTLEYKLRF